MLYNGSVPSAILATKLYIPPLRPKTVHRPRLIEQLNEGLSSHRKLTLISAPAGFSKTTLVSEWIADSRRPAAWLSLDEGDNDPACFVTYLVAAVQTIAPTIGSGAIVVLQSPRPPSTESMLTSLLNEIAAMQEDFILVLDDCHVIDSEPINMALTFLLEHLPPQMHLVIATREDPPLPLARLRARGQLTELRAADLRFTPTEAGDFLNQVMGLNLTAEDIAALEARTEGWIAGLQLAALSMQGCQDAASFIKSFTGSHRFLLDYLVEEVLQRQSESVQAFLLRTSILDRLCGPVCDAVLGSPPASGRKPWKVWSAPTCSLSRWTTNGVGTAITISLENSCGSGCTNAHFQATKRQAWPNAMSVPASGMKTTAWRLKRFITRLRGTILSAPRASLKETASPCTFVARLSPCWTGWRRCRPRCWMRDPR